ncbi:MAG: hypothetical protein QM504_11970 [Pseudomonadota bacterium]
MRTILLFTAISIISVGSHASDMYYCDKAKDLYKLAKAIEHPQAGISGTEKYHSNKDTYKQVIVKTTEGHISPEDYKKYRARCQTEMSNTLSH